jgi:short-subunit dehydrogenase
MDCSWRQIANARFEQDGIWKRASACSRQTELCHIIPRSVSGLAITTKRQIDLLTAGHHNNDYRSARRNMPKEWALITGASSGLGSEFARVLAAKNINLVLVARRADPMERLAAELRKRMQIEVAVLPLDISAIGSTATLERDLDARGISPTILVNNAAFGLNGEFLGQDSSNLEEMLRLDILSLVSLTHAFARKMTAAGHGHILLVASLAAYQPGPLMAVYAAAKSFVLSFGEALHVELAPKVNVTVVSPGLMETEFFGIANYTPKKSLRLSILPASVVAERGVKAMFDRKPSVVIGKINKVSAFSTRFFSRHVAAVLGYRMTKE